MAKRRGNGEGSVYRRGDGRVVGEYVDANGKRRYVSGKTKTEVKARLRKLLAERDEGIAYDSENLTVGAYLLRWLEAMKGTVRERTWERHEQVVRLHLGPTIGGVRLDRLNALQVQAVYGRKLEGLLLGGSSVSTGSGGNSWPRRSFSYPGTFYPPSSTALCFGWLFSSVSFALLGGRAKGFVVSRL